jgi:pyruvate formate lyase activating enzyme
VFTQGCNFNCLYCHNPETKPIKGGRKIGTKEMMERIDRCRSYFGKEGGVTISGGEPLLQAKNLIPLFSMLKKKGVHTALDTNGSVLNQDVKKLLKLTDLVLLDIKHIDPTFHKTVTGKTNETTLKFAEYLKENNIKTWLRYVLVPALTDQTEFLEQLQEHFKRHKNIDRIEILPYHTLGIKKYDDLKIDYHLKDTPTPDEKLITKTKKILEKGFSKVTIR